VTASIPLGGIYFYLSHLHRLRPPVNHWVKTFFDDLCAEVDKIANTGDNMATGFADLLPEGDERDAAMIAALGAAHVFVPLYTPEYVDRPSHERSRFEQRLETSPGASAHAHIQPVLWTPVPPHREPNDFAQALALGRGFPVYQRRGLEEMCRLKDHWPQYRMVVQRLAIRIVDAAETSSLTPSASGRPHAPLADLLPAVADPAPPRPDNEFVVAVIAPTLAWVPTGRARATYGARSSLWRPFERVPGGTVAGYAATVARGQGMPVRIVDFGIGIAPFEACPGVILVDPWTAAVEHGRHTLQAAFTALQDWATVVLVLNRDDPQAGRVMELAAEVLRSLPPSVSYVVTVRDAYEFGQLIPDVVARTRRRFIRHGPPIAPQGPPRPRLNEPGPSTAREPEEEP
jgi:FxsC-like protein